jgi:hypothetical protein
MSDNADQPQSSGNRWEPSGEAAEQMPPTKHDGEPVPAAAPARPAVCAAPDPAALPASRSTWWTRARAGVAGGAAAVLLAGGMGGFAVGRATAGDGPDVRLGQNGVPTGFDPDGDGLRGGGPGGPQLGQLPDGGQPPGLPGQDGGQQDDGSAGSDT